MDDLVSDYTVDHLLLEFASAVVLIRVADPCGMPRYVAILTTTQQNDLLEIVKMPGLAKFEEEGIFEWLCIFHGELVQAFDLVHLPHEPHSRLNHGVNTIQVPQMWSAEREEEAKLAMEVRDVTKTSSGYDSSHAVAHEVYDRLTRVLEIALDYCLHLVC